MHAFLRGVSRVEGGLVGLLSGSSSAGKAERQLMASMALNFHCNPSVDERSIGRLAENGNQV
jgi:hypothetical protein